MSCDRFPWLRRASQCLKTLSLKTLSLKTLSLKTLVSSLLAIALLGGCALPQVSAQERLFLDVSVDLVGSTILPKQSFEGEPVGGISAIAYDIPRDRLYALSDSRDRPRFYTLTLKNLTDPRLTVESVTYLKDAQGNPYAPGSLDPEGMALTPSNTLLIASEGSPKRQIAAAVGEYDLATGQLKTAIPIPERYLSDNLLNQTTATAGSENAAEEAVEDMLEQTQGVQENLSFEALAINVSSGTGGIYEPYRLFVATEGPLLQDLDFAPEIPYKNRLLHYTLDQYQTTFISEHLYEMDLAPSGAVLHGLSEIAVLDQGGHFLGLERSYGFQGFALKLYQLASGGATDISAIASLRNDSGIDPSGIQPIRKQLVLDFTSLPTPLQNYEAMTFGPTLPGGHESLLVMSDDNFIDEQETSLLVFQLNRP
ncbi:esterase-like activity of phytase family protein [Leptolyngbya sp. BC1307]|uniref:esterase-like activity of phytase family protein n=1 Tax=Leptolyngbya sp. BC1307 TaxID=2029589 RepID=UPI000EFD4A5D|nr:esterase-like activity of phytase family protein [Leptolyngbya sp. BC1307]